MKLLATLCVLAFGGAAFAADEIKITAVGSSFDAPKLTVAVNVKITAQANKKYYVVIVFVDNVQSLPMLKAAPFTTNGQGVIEFQDKQFNIVGMTKNTAYIFKAYLFPTEDDADNGTNRTPQQRRKPHDRERSGRPAGGPRSGTGTVARARSGSGRHRRVKSAVRRSELVPSREHTSETIAIRQVGSRSRY